MNDKNSITDETTTNQSSQPLSKLKALINENTGKIKPIKIMTEISNTLWTVFWANILFASLINLNIVTGKLIANNIVLINEAITYSFVSIIILISLISYLINYKVYKLNTEQD